MDYKEQFKHTKNVFESNMRGIFGSGGFSSLEKGMEYSLFSGGKRIRPVIMLRSGELFDAKPNDVLPFATALEMIHTYSLIHDDLPCMDDDSLRRGIPTNHMIFGFGNAVLNGDSLLNLAFETMLNAIDSEKKLRAARYIAKSSGRKGMCSGQSADLYFEKRRASIADIEYINVKKTGALLQSAFVCGGILGNANESEISLMEELGQKFGVLFQLTDDLLDKLGDEKTVGKTLGKDEAVDKSSFINIFGEEKTKKLVEENANDCISILKSMKSDTEFFKSLIIETVKRTY